MKKNTPKKRPRVRFLAAFLLPVLAFLASPAHAVSSEDLKKASLLNDSGIQKVRERNLDGAETDLLQALEYSGQNPKIRKNLGGVYFEKGLDILKRKKNIYESERYLKQALEIEPENPRYRRAWSELSFIKAGERAQKGDYQSALKLYEEAAQWDQKNINAWVQASHYAWKTQSIPKAREYFEKAKALDPNDKNVKILSEKLEKSGSESGNAVESSEHFILSADAQHLAEAGGHRVLYDLEEAYNAVSYKLSFYPKNKISVIFYPMKEFHQHWRLPGRVSGYFDGKLRIPYANSKISIEGLKPVFRHELTHAFVSNLNAQPIPKWLNEGLAQWVEGKAMDMKAKDAMVIYQITRRIPDIRHLDQVLAAQNNSFNNTEMTLAYMKSFSLVEYMAEEHGVWSVLELVKNYGTAPPEELFQKIFQCSIPELEAKWLRWVEAKKT